MIQPTVIYDTREQTRDGVFTGWTFPPDVVVERAKLNFGDYSVKGLTDLIVIERKSLPDLVACVGRERDRFERELTALRGYRYKAVIVEATLKQIEAGGWRGEVLPQSVLGSIAAWRIRYGVEVIYGGDAERAAGECWRMLRLFWNWTQDYARRFK